MAVSVSDRMACVCVTEAVSKHGCSASTCDITMRAPYTVECSCVLYDLQPRTHTFWITTCRRLYDTNDGFLCAQMQIMVLDYRDRLCQNLFATGKRQVTPAC